MRQSSVEDITTANASFEESENSENIGNEMTNESKESLESVPVSPAPNESSELPASKEETTIEPIDHSENEIIHEELPKVDVRNNIDDDNNELENEIVPSIPNTESNEIDEEKEESIDNTTVDEEENTIPEQEENSEEVVINCDDGLKVDQYGQCVGKYITSLGILEY